MRAFDWRRLFAEHRIAYIERGANVKRDEINIRCPFCGSADPSHHMGISLQTGWYSCWRNRAQHSGKSPVRLIMRLLRVPYGRAREIAGLGDDYVDPEGFDAVAARLMGRDRTGRPEETKRRHLEMPGDFLVVARRGRTRRHFEYLAHERGFDADPEKDLADLDRLYCVSAGVADRWADRVILPYFQDRELVTWTGRAIGGSTMRYRDLDRADSLAPPKETLFNHDALARGGDVLLVCEGPLDALKLDLYGRRLGVRAVGLSTNSATDEQAYLLQAAEGKFRRILVMMDQTPGGTGVVDSMRMRDSLGFIEGVGVVQVPFGAKDGAALTHRQIREWALQLKQQGEPKQWQTGSTT